MDQLAECLVVWLTKISGQEIVSLESLADCKILEQEAKQICWTKPSPHRSTSCATVIAILESCFDMNLGAHIQQDKIESADAAELIKVIALLTLASLDEKAPIKYYEALQGMSDEHVQHLESLREMAASLLAPSQSPSPNGGAQGSEQSSSYAEEKGVRGGLAASMGEGDSSASDHGSGDESFRASGQRPCTPTTPRLLPPRPPSTHGYVGTPQQRALLHTPISTRKSTRRALERVSQENDDLQEELREMQDELKERNEQVAALTIKAQRSDRLESELEDLKTELDELRDVRGRFDRMKRQYEDATEELDQLRAVERNLADALHTRDRLQEEKAVLEKKLQCQESASRRRITELQKDRTRAGELEGAVNAWKEAAEKAETQAKSLKTELSSAQKLLEQHESAKQTNAAETEAENARLREQLEETKKELAATVEERNKLLRASQDFEVKEYEYKQSLEELQDSCEQLKAACGQHQMKEVSTSTRVRELEQQLATLSDQSDAKNERLHTAEQRLAAAQTELEDLNSEHSRMRVRLAAAEQENAQLRAQLKKKEDGQASHSEALDAAQADVYNLQQKVNELQEKLEHKSRQNKELLRDYNLLIRRLKEDTVDMEQRAERRRQQSQSASPAVTPAATVSTPKSSLAKRQAFSAHHQPSPLQQQQPQQQQQSQLFAWDDSRRRPRPSATSDFFQPTNDQRLEELKRRNAAQPAHLRSSYFLETTNFANVPQDARTKKYTSPELKMMQESKRKTWNKGGSGIPFATTTATTKAGARDPLKVVQAASPQRPKKAEAFTIDFGQSNKTTATVERR